MQHAVFVNDKPLRFVDVYDIEQWKGNTDSLFVAEKDMTIEHAIEELESTSQHPGIIYMTASPDVAWKQFISYCQLMEASGGLVMRRSDEYLIIRRHNKWDLPKGKVEYEETPEQAAVREVKEECGLKEITVVKELSPTFHTYFLDGKRILKKTHWFLMSTEEEELIPQTDESIEQAKWMSSVIIKDKVLPDTYGSIKELLTKELGFAI